MPKLLPLPAAADVGLKDGDSAAERLDVGKKGNACRMPHDIFEADWKLLSKLKPLALDRLCQRILDEITNIAADQTSSHERYLAIFRLIEKRDDEIATTFNGFRRSTAVLSLSGMRTLGLVTDAELSQFSAETQATVNLLTRQS